jgi:hypothetical protein
MSQEQKPSAPTDGMKALAIAFANLPPDQPSYGRQRLPKSVTDFTGIHEWKRPLEIGRARIQKEVERAGVTLMFSVIDNGAKKVVGIGRTPAELDPARGGQFMIGAGRDRQGTADRYLMLVHQGIEGTPPTPFYLSAEQVQGISIAPGDENTAFNTFMDTPTEGRDLQVTGRVEAVALLE